MKYCTACRYDYFDNSTYEISPESTEDVPEDQVNVTKGLTEAPNQSSEDIDISDFRPTSKASPGAHHNISSYYNFIIILYILHYV
jgi:hypothetical protein